jgi:hypothetical protein
MKLVQKEFNLDEMAAGHMVRHKNIKQRINRLRRVDAPGGVDSTERSDIVISPELQVTYDQKQFLMADSKLLETDGDDRVITFCTSANLVLLGMERRWFGDGTFAVSPSAFKQLYTINVIKSGKCLPMVFSLLPSKDTEAYFTMFMQIFSKLTEDQYPTHFTHDFEKAPINAIRRVFGPNVKINGCLFHFMQALWRNMQKLGLAAKYSSNKQVRTTFRYLRCLPFLPVKDVIPAFVKISEQAPSIFKPMLTYFESTYIGKRVKNRPGMRKNPMFEIAIWSVHDRVMADEERTNNNLEAWHKVFEADVGIHPTPNKAVECMRLEQKNTDVILAQLRKGDVYPRRACEVVRDKLIKDHIQLWDNTFALDKDFFEFLSILISLLDQ